MADDAAKLIHLHKVMDAGRQIHDAMDRIDTIIAANLGINRSDLRCLYHLVESSLATPTELATSVGLTSGSVTTMLDRLESQGLIHRARSSADRRSVAISIPPHEHARITSIIEEKFAVIRAEFGLLDSAGLARMADALIPFATVLDTVGDRLFKRQS